MEKQQSNRINECQKIVNKMVEMKKKYPYGIMIHIHNRTVKEALKLCDDYEGALFCITSYSLKEFLEKLL